MDTKTELPKLIWKKVNKKKLKLINIITHYFNITTHYSVTNIYIIFYFTLCNP